MRHLILVRDAGGDLFHRGRLSQRRDRVLVRHRNHRGVGQVRVGAFPNPADCLMPLFECTTRNIYQYWQQLHTSQVHCLPIQATCTLKTDPLLSQKQVLAVRRGGERGRFVSRVKRRNARPRVSNVTRPSAVPEVEGTTPGAVPHVRE